MVFKMNKESKLKNIELDLVTIDQYSSSVHLYNKVGFKFKSVLEIYCISNSWITNESDYKNSLENTTKILLNSFKDFEQCNEKCDIALYYYNELNYYYENNISLKNFNNINVLNILNKEKYNSSELIGKIEDILEIKYQNSYFIRKNFEKHNNLIFNGLNTETKNLKLCLTCKNQLFQILKLKLNLVCVAYVFELNSFLIN